MKPKFYQLSREEKRNPFIYDYVTIYEPLGPKQLRRKLAEGWKITGNKHGDNLEGVSIHGNPKRRFESNQT